MAQGVFTLLLLLAASYAAGYFTRDYISRKRRASSRKWEKYIQADRPQHANTNLVQLKFPRELGDLLARHGSPRRRS